MSNARHTYSEIFLHVTWHCLQSRPLLRPEVESFVHAELTAYLAKTPGCLPLGVGGTETHVHLALQTEPDVLISELIGRVKGASAHLTNDRFGAGALEWQRGYGVVSFSKRHLAAVQEYIQRQKEHHARGTINDVLERMQRGLSEAAEGQEGSSKRAEARS